jgi:hypothetical protein
MLYALIATLFIAAKLPPLTPMNIGVVALPKAPAMHQHCHNLNWKKATRAEQLALIRSRAWQKAVANEVR